MSRLLSVLLVVWLALRRNRSLLLLVRGILLILWWWSIWIHWLWLILLILLWWRSIWIHRCWLILLILWRCIHWWWLSVLSTRQNWLLLPSTTGLKLLWISSRVRLIELILILILILHHHLLPTELWHWLRHCLLRNQSTEPINWPSKLVVFLLAYWTGWPMLLIILVRLSHWLLRLILLWHRITTRSPLLLLLLLVWLMRTCHWGSCWSTPLIYFSSKLIILLLANNILTILARLPRKYHVVPGFRATVRYHWLIILFFLFFFSQILVKECLFIFRQLFLKEIENSTNKYYTYEKFIEFELRISYLVSERVPSISTNCYRYRYLFFFLRLDWNLRLFRYLLFNLLPTIVIRV